MKHEGNGDTNCNWCTQNNRPRIGKGTGRLGNMRKSDDHPLYSIIKISQNSEKSLGNLRRLAVNLPGQNHRLTLL